MTSNLLISSSLSCLFEFSASRVESTFYQDIFCLLPKSIRSDLHRNYYTRKKHRFAYILPFLAGLRVLWRDPNSISIQLLAFSFCSTHCNLNGDCLEHYLLESAQCISYLSPVAQERDIERRDIIATAALESAR